MSEHYTKGRQGQGARRRKNRYQSRGRYQRMPRPDNATATKPSLLQRILGFFGIGKKKQAPKKATPAKQEKGTNNNTRTPRQPRPAKNGTSERRRLNSTPPTRNGRLYVGNLSYEVNESELEDLFKGFGDVKSIEIIYNPRTYRSKGYAFVEMRHTDAARQAAEVLHGQPFMGRELMVSAANDRQASDERMDKQEWKTVPMEKTAKQKEERSPEPETSAETESK